MTNQEADGDIDAELVSTIQGLNDLLQKVDKAEKGLEDEFPIPPDDADKRGELVQKRQQAIAKCREELQDVRNRTQSLLDDILKRLNLHRQTGSVLTEIEREQADELAREIVEELREFCPPALEDWDKEPPEEKKRIVAEKLRKVERHLAYEGDPKLNAYRKDLKSEWEYLQRLKEFESETRFDPVEKAKTVFDGMERPESADTKIPEKVRKWIAKSHEFYKEKKGSEKAKDRILSIAEQHSYHFSRSGMEKFL